MYVAESKQELIARITDFKAKIYTPEEIATKGAVAFLLLRRACLNRKDVVISVMSSLFDRYRFEQLNCDQRTYLIDWVSPEVDDTGAWYAGNLNLEQEIEVIFGGE